MQTEISFRPRDEASLGIISAGDQTAPRPETRRGQEVKFALSHMSLLSGPLTHLLLLLSNESLQSASASSSSARGQSSARAACASPASRTDVDDEALHRYQSY